MTRWLLLPLLLLAFAPHVLSLIRHDDLAKYEPPNSVYNNPEGDAALEGWNVAMAPDHPKRFVMLKKIEIDAYCNVIVSVKELSEDIYQQAFAESHPYPNCPYSVVPQVAEINDDTRNQDGSYKKVEIMFMPEVKDLHSLADAVFNSNEIQRLAKEQQKKVYEKQNILRACPHSFQMVFQNYGTNGHRTLQIRDIVNCVPADWTADFLYDQQQNQLRITANQCGKLYSCPPGATVNIGATAWLYDPETHQVLTLKKKPFGKKPYSAKPGGNLDIVEDLMPITLHPNYESLSEGTRLKLSRGFIDWSHTALRELIEETGLYDKNVRQDVGPDLIEAFLKTEPKLMHLEDWVANPIAPSVNFHVVYEVKGISKLNTDKMKLAVEEGVVSAQFEDVCPKDQYAIEHAMPIRQQSEFTSNFSTRPVPPVDDPMPIN